MSSHRQCFFFVLFFLLGDVIHINIDKKEREKESDGEIIKNVVEFLMNFSFSVTWIEKKKKPINNKILMMISK